MGRAVALPVLILSLLLVAGCTKQGTTRSDSMEPGPSSDMTDSTGQFGKTAQKGAGDIYVKLAIGYMREGRLDIALQKAKTAVEVEPTNADAHNIIALLYDRLSEPGLAESHFKRSLKLDPQNSYILNAYGTFLCQQQRYDEADRQFNGALSNPLYQTPEVALTNAGICAKRKADDAVAEGYLRRALERNPTFPSALFQMAVISYDQGDHLSARGYLQRFLAVAQPTPGSLWLGIQNERKLGDQDAVASYTLLLRNKYPDSQEMQFLRASEQQ